MSTTMTTYLHKNSDMLCNAKDITSFHDIKDAIQDSQLGANCPAHICAIISLLTVGTAATCDICDKDHAVVDSTNETYCTQCGTVMDMCCSSTECQQCSNKFCKDCVSLNIDTCDMEQCTGEAEQCFRCCQRCNDCSRLICEYCLEENMIITCDVCKYKYCQFCRETYTCDCCSKTVCAGCARTVDCEKCGEVHCCDCDCML